MSPKEVILNWVKAFNNKDADAIGSMYHIDAVNHQVNNAPLKGRVAIENMFRNEFSRAEMVCIIEKIFEDGDWAILEWKDPLGLRGCGLFEVINDKINFQRGYWDMLTFLRQQRLPLPTE